ncbi:MAG: hypothetical protein WCL28_06085 [bacterium]
MPILIFTRKISAKFITTFNIPFLIVFKKTEEKHDFPHYRAESSAAGYEAIKAQCFGGDFK